MLSRGRAGLCTTTCATRPSGPRLLLTTPSGRQLRCYNLRQRQTVIAEAGPGAGAAAASRPGLRRTIKRAITAPGSGSAGIELAPHKPVGLMLFSAYMLGTASALSGGGGGLPASAARARQPGAHGAPSTIR
jgi:hypothetical protein